MAALDEILGKMKFLEASDLHLRSGMRPRYRIQGQLREVVGSVPIPAGQLEAMTREILTDEQEKLYLDHREIDFAYGSTRVGRFRCNYFRDHRGPAAVFRRLPAEIPTLRELNLPPSVEALAHLRGGLVLVTGPTGSGKTSTLAALLDLVNTQYRKHIITLEDPIEYLHASKRAVVQQRGLHYDFLAFADGVRDALREDVDLLLIGEMRDLETIRMALSAAEVGTLVFATLHTNGAQESIDRIIDVFPAEEQAQIRAMLSQSLAGVVSQVLLQRVDTGGRIPATEVLFGGPAISNLVREGKVQDITTVIQAGKQQGMHTLDDSLMGLVTRKLVAPEEAWSYADNKAWFEQFLRP